MIVISSQLSGNIMFYEIILFCSLHCVLSVEKPVREQDLNPHNYTQHSYQSPSGSRSEKFGPVVFLTNEDVTTDPVVSSPRDNRIQDVPYQKVKRKYKKKNIGRVEIQDEKINSQLEQALAKHGAKVLKLPPEKLARGHIPFVRDIQTNQQNYAFSYKVLDHSSGDDFSHSQVQNSKATNGEYRVKLPDGRLQIVSYTADQNGYKADVKYTDSEENTVNFYRQDPIYRIEQLAVKKFVPVKTNRKYPIDYYDETQSSGRGDEEVKLKTAIPANYDGSYDRGYENIVVTPSPGYSNGGAVSANANYQLPVPINVQIYTTNARDYQNAGSYIPTIVSTPLTYHSKNINHYRQPAVSAQIINNGDQGIYLPLSTPSSFVLTDNHGQVIDNIELVTSTAVPFVLSTTSSPLNFVTAHSTAATPTTYD
ncbi:uncharacterized protein LOC130897402 [Diorhabda carinulata]|uniref:uncharacterized protein LOC130897402 n=1 Tax=Diorhabda carinulata TaxID=1163345 RepID=UPI0025A1249D|nr:uncharacterized protein LOC130897402 [Diorhabda carinulata]